MLAQPETQPLDVDLDPFVVYVRLHGPVLILSGFRCAWPALPS